jgi:hypothetical protein
MDTPPQPVKSKHDRAVILDSINDGSLRLAVTSMPRRGPHHSWDVDDRGRVADKRCHGARMTEKAKFITFHQIHGKSKIFQQKNWIQIMVAAPHLFGPTSSGRSFVGAPPLMLLATVVVSGCSLSSSVGSRCERKVGDK